MDELKHYKTLINDAVKSYALNQEPKELYEPINYILNLGGKRIRPALLLMANDLFGGITEKAVPAALAIEVFHNFSLVHDDIMDEAPYRRGNPTVHKKWGRDIAILSGDVMLVKSVELLCKSDPHLITEIISIFNHTAVEVCEGQQYDMNFEKASSVSIEDYLNMITLKTAVLIGASLKIGAVLGGASKTDANHLYEYGKNLGVAFQLMDDILDLYGKPDKVGKKVGGDVIANKKTILLLKALELAEGKLKQELDFCLTSKAISPEDKVARVKSIFDQLDVKQHALNEMELFYNTSIAHLDSVTGFTSGKAPLEVFAKKLMSREY